MKFAKNQQIRTLKPENRLKKTPGAVPKSEGKIMKKGSSFKNASNSQFNGKGGSKTALRKKLAEGLIDPDFLGMVKNDLINKHRMSMPMKKYEIQTPVKAVPKKRMPNFEGRLKRWEAHSSADDWLESSVEQDEVESILPTRNLEQNLENKEETSSSDEMEHEVESTTEIYEENPEINNKNEDETSSSNEDEYGVEMVKENLEVSNTESEEETPPSGETQHILVEQVSDESSSAGQSEESNDEHEVEMVEENPEVSDTESEEETSPSGETQHFLVEQISDESSSTKRAEESEDETLKRAGVEMFSGTSNMLNDQATFAAGKKARKNKGEDGKADLLNNEAPAATGEKMNKVKRKQENKVCKFNPEDPSSFSYFKEKLQKCSNIENPSKSQSRTKRKYQRLVRIIENIEAGNLSGLKKKFVSDMETSDGISGGKVDIMNKVDKTNKKTRFVLFVGNLPYTIDESRIIEHFKKAGNVVSVRIPLDKETNKSRGFAFIELTNKESYERALSLHHTFIESRRINVQYSNSRDQQDTSAKKGMKAKNLKLAAMRKEGLLAGSVKESHKRSARRRTKKNKAQTDIQ